MIEGKPSPLHPSTKSVLVVPTISRHVGDRLWHLSAAWPKAATQEGTKLKKGDAVFRYKIGDISSSDRSRLLKSLLNVRTNFDLSLNAPFDGIYHPSNTYFGGGTDDAPHDVSYASRLAGDNRYTGNYTEIFSQAALCIELSETRERALRLNGFQAHSNFFETLEGQAATINQWLKRSTNFDGDHDAFWEHIHSESERLKAHACAIIPIEELRR